MSEFKNIDMNAVGQKILLTLLPFWSPLIPPGGISCLKSFLKKNGYNVKTADANVDETLRDAYYKYFDVLKKCVPENKQGNFYNIGNDVLQNHMLAFLNQKDEKVFFELIKTIVFNTFFCTASDHNVMELNNLVKLIFQRLEVFFFELLDRERPTILGLSVFSGCLPASLFAFKLTKEKYPDIVTVMGGGVFSNQLDVRSPNFETFLQNTPYIDKILIGEGENLFLKLLKGELDNSKRVYTLNDINNETIDLSSVDIPDFSDLEVEFYPYLTAYTSRSCPFQCSFCSETLQWGKYRKKDAKQIVKELKKLYKQFSRQLFLMGDSLLNPIATPLAKQLIESDVTIYWDGYLRADKPVCNKDNTFLWRRGGLYRARLGVESGSQHILDLMDKKITPERIKEAISSLAEAGIKTTTYWVIGHPDETEEDFQETLNLIEEVKDDIYEADCNPFNFYFTGQVGSDQWLKENKCSSLFPETADDMLMLKTWILNKEPSREIIYQRLNRFVAACRKMGVPNPYSMYEIQKADERWKKLHKNSVPNLMEFNTDNYVTECKKVKKPMFSKNRQINQLGYSSAFR